MRNKEKWYNGRRCKKYQNAEM